MNTRARSKHSRLTFALVGWAGMMAACGSDVPLGIQDRDSGSTETGGATGHGGSGSGGAQGDAATGNGGAQGGSGGTLAVDAPIGTGDVATKTGGQIGSGGLLASGGRIGSGGATGTGGSTGKVCGGIAGITCPTGQFCDLASNCNSIADATGTCVLTGTGVVCDTSYNPVCGCDGKTYPNDCNRTVAGVLKAANGACAGGTGGKAGTGGAGGRTGTGGSTNPGGTGGRTGTGGSTGTGGASGQTCGGEAGIGCPTGQFCDLASKCGAIADALGTCRPTGPGLGCITVADPVCGCDGKTYPSDCDRAVAGMLKASDGVCPASVDAGATSCADAYLAWLAPGGVAGTGPAVVVCAKGWADTWTNVSPFPREAPPSSATGTYTLTSTQTSDLFTLLAAVDFASVPHGTASFVECYPSLYLRTCSTCAPTTLSYNVPAQLSPEMEQVWLWFDQLLGASSFANPRNYCNFNF